jgi:hypothetical protein
MRQFVLILAGLSLPATAFAAASQQPIEPIDVPPSIEQGLDMVYIDREIAPSIQQRDEQQQARGLEDFRAVPVDMFAPVHPLYTDLRRAPDPLQDALGLASAGRDTVGAGAEAEHDG